MALSLQRLVAAIALMVCWQAVAGDGTQTVYQWSDERGRVHFGDRPSQGATESRKIEPSSVNSTDGNRRAEQQRLLEVMTAERQSKKAAQARQRADRIEHEKRCEELAVQLEELEHGHVVYYRENAEGEREYVDEESRGKQAKLQRMLYEKNCG